MLPKRTFLLTVLLTLFFPLVACGSWRGPADVKDLSEDYQTIQGRLAAPPVLEKGDKRLFLYISREQPIDGEKEVIVCVAFNDERERILRDLAERAVEVDEPLFIFARPVEGKWHEYVEGVDFEVYAVGYYNPSAKRYMTVITTYGNSLTDMFRSIGWRQFLSEVGKRAIKTAI